MKPYAERYPPEIYPKAVNPENKTTVQKLDRIVYWANNQIDKKNTTGNEIPREKVNQFHQAALKLIYRVIPGS